MNPKRTESGGDGSDHITRPERAEKWGSKPLPQELRDANEKLRQLAHEFDAIGRLVNKLSTPLSHNLIRRRKVILNQEFGRVGRSVASCVRYYNRHGAVLPDKLRTSESGIQVLENRLGQFRKDVEQALASKRN